MANKTHDMWACGACTLLVWVPMGSESRQCPRCSDDDLTDDPIIDWKSFAWWRRVFGSR